MLQTNTAKTALMMEYRKAVGMLQTCPARCDTAKVYINPMDLNRWESTCSSLLALHISELSVRFPPLGSSQFVFVTMLC